MKYFMWCVHWLVFWFVANLASAFAASVILIGFLLIAGIPDKEWLSLIRIFVAMSYLFWSFIIGMGMLDDAKHKRFE